MIPDSDLNDTSLSLDSYERLDEVSERFEDAIRADERPQIESFLGDTSEPDRTELFRELLLVELELAAAKGRTVTEAMYVPRFPEYRAIIGDAFRWPHGTIPPEPTPPDVRSLSEEGFEILSELGRGGMGVVYKARQVRLNRIVALKVLRGNAADDREYLARFQAEAETVARFQHPNIVQIHEVGERHGVSFLALEYVDGGSLQEHLAGKPQDPRAAAMLMMSVARALHYAHEHGIVHRDLKPANILLQKDEGGRMKEENNQTASDSSFILHPSSFQVKIADFGLAKRLDGASLQTQSGVVAGTPSYMAPEQVWGRTAEISSVSDVYAAGATLYEMLTGRPPFHGATTLETLKLVADQEPVPPSRLQPTVPRDLETICLKCLEKALHKRYASAAELADDLELFLDGRPIQARPVGRLERAWKWARRRPALAGLLVISATAITLGIVGGVYHVVNIEKALASTKSAEESAKNQRDIAITANKRLVYEIQKMVTDRPETQKLRLGLLETAVGGLRNMKAATTDPKLSNMLDVDLAHAHWQIGDVHLKQFDERDKALVQFELCRQLAADVLARDPEDVGAKDRLCLAYLRLGTLSLKNNQPTKAQVHFRSMLDIAEPWYRADPEHPWAREHAYGANGQLGHAYEWAWKLEAARPYLWRSREIADKWVEDAPKDHFAKDCLAISHQRIGNWHKTNLDISSATVSYSKAIRVRCDANTAAPENVRYKWNLFAMCGIHGRLSQTLGNLSDAQRSFDEARRIVTDLAAADPDNVETQHSKLHALIDCGQIEQEMLEHHKACDWYRQARELMEKLGKDERQKGNATKRDELKTKLDDAVSICELMPRVVNEPNVARDQPLEVQYELLQAQLRLLALQGRHDEALATAELLCSQQPQDKAELFHLARACAACLRPEPLGSAERTAQLRCAARALEALKQAQEKGYKRRDLIKEEPRFGPLHGNPEFRALLKSQ